MVDDEPDQRFLLRRIFERAGHEVSDATDGAAALRAVRESAPDLVVTDMMMPVMNGAAVIEEIRRINPSARIVAVSGIDIGEQTMESVDDFLAKPYSAADLVKTIREVLDRPVGAAR